MTYSIQKATDQDIPAIARVHLDSKRAAESGIVDQAYLEDMTYAEFENKWVGYLKAEETSTDILFLGDRLAGFVSYGPLRTPPAGMSKIRPLYSSEIYAIYVHPDYFNQGYGKILFQHGIKNLMEQKHQSVCLWALDKNKRACNFYNKMSGQRVGKQIVEMGKTKVKEACYAWRDIKEILEK